jgi:hypothetical protein
MRTRVGLKKRPWIILTELRKSPRLRLMIKERERAERRTENETENGNLEAKIGTDDEI